MKQARTLIISAVIAIFGAAVLIPATPALAVVNPLAICDTDAGSDNEICKEENRNDNASELIGIVVNTLLFIELACSSNDYLFRYSVHNLKW